MVKNKGHIPIRTCISCGSKRPKHDLIRLFPDKQGRLVRDMSGNMPGRGAYVCKNIACQRNLLGNRRLSRLFRTDMAIKVDQYTPLR